MNTIRKTAAMAAFFIMLLTSCGNAGARNDEHRKSADKNVVTELNTEEFQEKVYDMKVEGLKFLGDKPAIVDFTASWCGPCRRIAPILEELAAEYGDRITIYKVDIDKNRDLAKAFNVSSIPAILYIPLDGEPTMTVGSRDKARFQTEIESILLKD